ncbi:multiheme c-type cytochrome [Lignipirellula cremea]|uniref:Cytochrome c-552/4 domain-containing protein n=1 Tax=Lignipirellula cremea TaxID=2528010 RepID=A0A518DV94_9BACT|nr:multiheme c-type cytochrome [Lignipirellula cremea]QDU95753.1 hypothetical protein Pla8534_35700 [Lignipirellula cremea]
MPLRPRLYQQLLLFAVAALALTAGWSLVDQPAEFAVAAPHTITRRPHPFDPDWLEVQNILRNKCTQCHRAGTDRTDFTTYQSLIEAKQDGEDKIVVPGDPKDSVLYSYVAWNVNAKGGSDLPDSPEMPPEKHEWLSAGQLATVKRWIENGALQYCLPQTCNITPLMESDFPSARQCAGCHPKQYEEWSRSMHAYAQHSPVFEAFNLTLVERTGGTIGTFCSRCHTPIGTALGENESVRNVHRSQLSMEGVSCVVCHRRSHRQYKSSGRVTIDPGSLEEVCVYGPFDDPVSKDHHAHKAAGLPYIKSSQFCGECHDVTNPAGVRLEEAFSEWQNSPAARQGVTCQSCHMGEDPGIPTPDHERPLGVAAVLEDVAESKLPQRRLTDHTFAGPDYSLLPDTEFPHRLDWMYEQDYRDEKNLTPYQQATLRDLRKRNREQLDKATELRHRLLRNSMKMDVAAPLCAKPGEKIGIAVDVSSLITGHNIPTGFTAERQVWVHIEVRDHQDRLVFASGDLDSNGDLRDDHSHDVLTGKAAIDFHLMNFQSKFVALTNKGTERSVVISVNRHLMPVNVLRPAPFPSASFGRPPTFRVSKGSLRPLETRTKVFPVVMPPCVGPCTVSVKLNFRHLPPSLLDHIGTPHLKHLLEIVEIESHQSVIEVTP